MALDKKLQKRLEKLYDLLDEAVAQLNQIEEWLNSEADKEEVE